MTALDALRPAAPGVPDAAPTPPAGTPPVRVAGDHGWRWLRLVTPVSLLLLISAFSAIMYVVEQPDVTDQAYLAPQSRADIGASRLAGILTGRGVQLERVTHSSDALVSAYRGDATLVLPTPTLMHPYYLRMLKLLPASTRVVVIAPSQRSLAAGLLPADIVDERLAAKVIAPACALPAGVNAGAAAVGRSRFTEAYAGEGTFLYQCYSNALVGFRRGAAEVTVVGAADPFRNDRIGEHDNSALAVGLLGRAPRLIWLDLHGPEQRPGLLDDPALASAPPAPASLGPGSPDPDFPMPRGSHDGVGAPSDEPPQAAGANPLWQAFPSSAFAAAALVALAALLLAVALGRRLATPVAEPLPVSVRATETVEGRGRLYHRAKARGPSLHTIADAARDRFTRLLDLPAGTAEPELIAAVAAQSGWSPEEVAAALYPPEPATDQALVSAAVALDTLYRAVTRQAPPTAVPEGEFR